MVELHSYQFKTELIKRVQELINKILLLFTNEMYTHITDLVNRYEEICELLSSTPRITEELVKLRELYNEAPTLIRNMELGLPSLSLSHTHTHSLSLSLSLSFSPLSLSLSLSLSPSLSFVTLN